MNKKNLREGYRVRDVFNDPETVRFLPYIRTNRVEDMNVLRSWQQYFTAKDIPWVVLKVRLYKSSKYHREEEVWELWKHGVEE